MPWVSRFGRLIATLEIEEQARQDWHAEALVHESEEDVPHPTHGLEHARAIVESVQRLDRETRPPGETAGWDAYVDWAEGLRHTFILDNPDWPASEVAAAEALDAALDSLRQATAVEPDTTLQSFRDSLAAALDARGIDEGRAGVGILLTPFGASIGAGFAQTRSGTFVRTNDFVAPVAKIEPLLTSCEGTALTPTTRRDFSRC